MAMAMTGATEALQVRDGTHKSARSSEGPEDTRVRRHRWNRLEHRHEHYRVESQLLYDLGEETRTRGSFT